jgi:hypothetical protein
MNTFGKLGCEPTERSGRNFRLNGLQGNQKLKGGPSLAKLAQENLRASFSTVFMIGAKKRDRRPFPAHRPPFNTHNER